jgi:hypothetical protein
VESKNLNHLLLIPFRLAREAPGTAVTCA